MNERQCKDCFWRRKYCGEHVCGNKQSDEYSELIDDDDSCESWEKI